MKKIKQYILSKLGLTTRKHYYFALRMARHWRRKYNEENGNREKTAKKIVEGIKKAMDKMGFSAGASMMQPHEYVNLYECDQFSIHHCTTCNDDRVFIESKFPINEDLQIILESLPDVDEVVIIDKKDCAVELSKGCDRKAAADRIAKKVNDYILI